MTTNSDIVRLGALSLNVDAKLVEIESSADAEIRLQIEIGCSVDGRAVVDRIVADKSVSISWPESNTTLVIESSGTADNVPWIRYHFRWQDHSTDAASTVAAPHYRRDNIRLASGGNWYGGPELAEQTWPLGVDQYTMAPYIAGDVNAAFGSGLERYWLASNRYAVHVPVDIPLWVEHKNGRLSLQAQIVDCIYDNFIDAKKSPILEYFIYSCHDTSSLRQFHSAVFGSLYERPQSIPDERMIVEPVWTTWARYKADIDQQKVYAFANEIITHQFPISQIELDDAWATAYGDFTFDPIKFSNPAEMCTTLTKQNIRLTLWMHPFVNVDSVNGRDRSKHHMYVQDDTGAAPCIADWWHGKAYVVDFTNSTATEWFIAELNTLRALGVHSFKFDAGELNYFPRKFRLNRGSMPNDFARAYVKMASQFGGAIEIRVFSGTQRIGAFVRTLDRYSSWTDSGLDTILPVALNFSLLGYPFNLPDMIGGNAYRVAAPEKELYIRWIQTNVFLLAAQFSFAPWQFDAETVSICRQMLELRARFADYLLAECRKCLQSSGALSVIRPMWWLSDSEDAFVCHDQFLVGDDLIVAPILVSGERERSVFLPEGDWKSCIDDEIYRGPVRIGPLSVPLERLLYFVRHRESTSHCQIF